MKQNLFKLFLCFLVFLSACKKETTSTTSTTTGTGTSSETSSTYTVTFNSNGGTSISAQSVKSGKKAIQPTNPTKTGYTFEGWYGDAVLTAPFSFSTAITSHITLYARFISTVVINGKTYKTVVIGTQTWLAENLNDDRNTQGISSCYINNSANCTTYGRLYDWAAAMDMDSKIAGWHLPSNAELDFLANVLGGADVAAGKMKVGGSSGFNALFAASTSRVATAASSTWAATPFFGRPRLMALAKHGTYSYFDYLDSRSSSASLCYSVRLLKD